MRRGDLYRVARPDGRDPKRFRVFVVVSRQASIDSRFSTVICAPVYTARHGLATQVDIGPREGLRHDSSIHCDELLSLHKSRLTHFVGSLATWLAPPIRLTADVRLRETVLGKKPPEVAGQLDRGPADGRDRRRGLGGGMDRLDPKLDLR